VRSSSSVGAIISPFQTAHPIGWTVRKARGTSGSGIAPRGLGAGFAALAVDLGGDAVRPAAGAGRFALAAIGGAFEAVTALPGWLAVGLWQFACAVSGGRLIAANTISPYLIVGWRRFMPPVPP
jgi:hypothetical protein